MGRVERVAVPVRRQGPAGGRRVRSDAAAAAAGSKWSPSASPGVSIEPDATVGTLRPRRSAQMTTGSNSRSSNDRPGLWRHRARRAGPDTSAERLVSSLRDRPFEPRQASWAEPSEQPRVDIVVGRPARGWPAFVGQAPWRRSGEEPTRKRAYVAPVAVFFSGPAVYLLFSAARSPSRGSVSVSRRSVRRGRNRRSRAVFRAGVPADRGCRQLPYRTGGGASSTATFTATRCQRREGLERIAFRSVAPRASPCRTRDVD